MPRFKPTAVWMTLTCLGVTPIFADDPRIGHSFDAPETVWRFLGSAVPAEMLVQEHLAEGARDEHGCERLVVAAPAGQSALVGCSVPHVAVLEELKLQMWVKASRPDIQLAARVVMPRSLAPDGQSPATAIVRGQRYGRPTQWQQLLLSDVPKLLAAEVRAMRTIPGTRIDPREAFVDAVVLILPGDSHGVEVVTDDLNIDGVLQPHSKELSLVSFPNAPAAPYGLGPATEPTTRVNSASSHRTPPQVRLQGSLLLVEGRPFAPRAIQWQGEPLNFLADLGFNAVQLESMPTNEQILAAERQNLWFICVPPRPDRIARDGLGKVNDRVIGWHLNDAFVETDAQYAANWAQLVRQHDAIPGRPVLMAPEVQWEAMNQTADIAVARHPRAAVLNVEPFSDWLMARTDLVRPEMALWMCLPTQFGKQAAQQSAGLSGMPLEFSSLDEIRLGELQQAAWLAGCRGMVLESNSALHEPTNAARRRAVALELINRRQQFMDPWMASGQIVARLSSEDAKWAAALFHADGARLVVPFKSRSVMVDESPSPTSAQASAEQHYIVPGIAESAKAFYVSAVSFRQISITRVAGGMRVIVPTDRGGMVLITEDPKIIQAVRQRISRDAARIAKLELQLAELRLKSFVDAQEQAGVPAHFTSTRARQAAAWAKELRACADLLAAGRIEPAFDRTAAVCIQVADAIEEQERSLFQTGPLFSNPLALSHDHLPSYVDFLQSLSGKQGGENLLYGGDFEDLSQVVQSGWQHVNHAAPGIDAGARISGHEPRHGNHCLELFATISASGAAGNVATSPVWVVSPPVPLDTEDIIEVSGWVRIDEAITGSTDGLQIVDTLGGAELALSVRKTSGWQQFQMVRAAFEPTEMRITFALTGLGMARIDGVMVRILKAPTVRRLPPAASAAIPVETAEPAHTANITEHGPLLTAPVPR